MGLMTFYGSNRELQDMQRYARRNNLLARTVMGAGRGIKHAAMAGYGAIAPEVHRFTESKFGEVLEMKRSATDYYHRSRERSAQRMQERSMRRSSSFMSSGGMTQGRAGGFDALVRSRIDRIPAGLREVSNTVVRSNQMTQNSLSQVGRGLESEIRQTSTQQMAIQRHVGQTAEEHLDFERGIEKKQGVWRKQMLEAVKLGPGRGGASPGRFPLARGIAGGIGRMGLAAGLMYLIGGGGLIGGAKALAAGGGIGGALSGMRMPGVGSALAAGGLAMLLPRLLGRRRRDERLVARSLLPHHAQMLAPMLTGGVGGMGVARTGISGMVQRGLAARRYRRLSHLPLAGLTLSDLVGHPHGMIGSINRAATGILGGAAEYGGRGAAAAFRGATALPAWLSRVIGRRMGYMPPGPGAAATMQRILGANVGRGFGAAAFPTTGPLTGAGRFAAKYFPTFGTRAGIAGMLSGAGGLLSKHMSKIIPGLGAAYGMSKATGQFKKGDYIGGMFSGAGGIASLIPGLGGFIGMVFSVLGDLLPQQLKDVGNKIVAPFFNKMSKWLEESLGKERMDKIKGIFDGFSELAPKMESAVKSIADAFIEHGPAIAKGLADFAIIMAKTIGLAGKAWNAISDPESWWVKIVGAPGGWAADLHHSYDTEKFTGQAATLKSQQKRQTQIGFGGDKLLEEFSQERAKLVDKYNEDVKGKGAKDRVEQYNAAVAAQSAFEWGLHDLVLRYLEAKDNGQTKLGPELGAWGRASTRASRSVAGKAVPATQKLEDVSKLDPTLRLGTQGPALPPKPVRTSPLPGLGGDGWSLPELDLTTPFPATAASTAQATASAAATGAVQVAMQTGSFLDKIYEDIAARFGDKGDVKKMVNELWEMAKALPHNSEEYMTKSLAMLNEKFGGILDPEQMKSLVTSMRNGLNKATQFVDQVIDLGMMETREWQDKIEGSLARGMTPIPGAIQGTGWVPTEMDAGVKVPQTLGSKGTIAAFREQFKRSWTKMSQIPSKVAGAMGYGGGGGSYGGTGVGATGGPSGDANIDKFRQISALSVSSESGGNLWKKGITGDMGKYQFTPGDTAVKYAAWLSQSADPEFRQIGSILSRGPGSEALWKQVADSPLRNKFEISQDMFAKKLYWDPIEGLVGGGSMALKQAAFATSIHKGPGTVQQALAGIPTGASDDDKINALYTLRIAKSASMPGVVANVQAERKRLAAGGGGGITTAGVVGGAISPTPATAVTGGTTAPTVAGGATAATTAAATVATPATVAAQSMAADLGKTNGILSKIQEVLVAILGAVQSGREDPSVFRDDDIAKLVTSMGSSGTYRSRDHRR